MSIKRTGGALVGILIVGAGVAGLFWNEGASVDRIETIDASRQALVEADPARVEPGLAGRLVHLTGEATGGAVADATFGLAVDALRLDREVEMFQWIENKRRKGDSNQYTYTYTMGWRGRRQEGFVRPAGHTNPPMPYTSERYYPPVAMLGAYRLSRALVDDLRATQPVTPQAVEVADLPPLAVVEVRLQTGDPAQPTLGDLRVEFAAVPAQTVSVLAGLADGELIGFATEHGDMTMIEPGAMPADAMLDLATTRNTTFTWVVRAIGTVVVFFGLFWTLNSAVSWIPFVRSLSTGAAALAALVLAVPVAMTAIAFSWLWFRPLWAVGLLCAASLGPLFLALRNRRRTPVAAAPPPPPPR